MDKKVTSKELFNKLGYYSIECNDELVECYQNVTTSKRIKIDVFDLSFVKEDPNFLITKPSPITLNEIEAILLRLNEIGDMILKKMKFNGKILFMPENVIKKIDEISNKYLGLNKTNKKVSKKRKKVNGK